jgi:TrmH family RNA methyltransferase
MVAPRNPLNIGAAARAMSNFGFLKLRVVNPYEVAYREAKSAVNASAVLNDSVQPATVAEAVGDCTLVVGTTSLGHRQLQHPLRRLEYGGRLIRKHLDGGGTVALLFGSEKFGLGNEDMSHCHWLIRIPTRDEHESMNLGQAVAVCLYELIRDAATTRRKPEPVAEAKAEDLERFSTILLELLDVSGYTNPRTVVSTEAKVRRIIRRLNMPGKDAQQWAGMFRQILWKIKGRE